MTENPLPINSQALDNAEVGGKTGASPRRAASQSFPSRKQAHGRRPRRNAGDKGTKTGAFWICELSRIELTPPNIHTSAFSLAGSKFRPPHEVPQRRREPVGRFFCQKVAAILELVQYVVRQRRYPPLKLLPAERDVLQSPEQKRRLISKGRAVIPDGTQPVTRAGDEARQRGAGGAGRGRWLGVAVMSHDFRRQDATVANRPWHDRIHEHVAMANQMLADHTRHQEAERLEMEVVADRPAPSIRNDETADPFRMPAREVQTDRPAPVVHDQGDASKSQMIEQGR